MTVQLNMCGDRKLSPRQAPSGPDLVIHLITGINLMEKSETVISKRKREITVQISGLIELFYSGLSSQSK